MFPRTFFRILVASLILLVVAVAVLLAFHMLVGALGDEVGSRALQWVGFGCLMLLVIVVLLLVTALGIEAAGRGPARDDRDERA